MNKTNLRIAIIGAGPAGATMGAVLQKRGLAFEIFEREKNLESRDQGGSLDMKEDSGQIALHLAGVHEEFLRLSRPEGQESKIYASTGKLMFSEAADHDESYMPEIDRGQLRKLLLDQIPQDRVHWETTIQSIESKTNGTQHLHFSNGSEAIFDLVVGADGAWSKIRPILSKAQPQYSGVTFFEIAFSDVDRRFPEIAALVGHGKIFAPGNNRTIIAQRSDKGQIRAYLALRVSLSWVQEQKNKTAQEMRTLLLQEFQGWSPKLLSLVERCEDSFIPRPIYALPVPHRWEHKKGLTLLGDAAHLMSPFSGMGANLAMLEGAELAVALAENENFDKGVQSFEATMIARGAECAHDAAQGIDGAISENALQDILGHFAEIETMKKAKASS